MLTFTLIAHFDAITGRDHLMSLAMAADNLLCDSERARIKIMMSRPLYTPRPPMTTAVGGKRRPYDP